MIAFNVFAAVMCSVAAYLNWPLAKKSFNERVFFVCNSLLAVGNIVIVANHLIGG